MEKLVQKISKESSLSEKEIWEKINQRQKELSNLISEKGAAHMIAKEMGVEVEAEEAGNKIGNLEEGKAKFMGKVTGKSGVKEFDTEKGSGEVANIFLGDETGKIRLSLWNEQTQYLDEIEKGDVLQISGFIKKDNRGKKEAILGKYGKMKKVDKDIEVKDTSEKKKDLVNPKRGEKISTRAALLKVFESKPFFEVCEECGKSLNDGKCEKHGEVDGKDKLVLSGIIDDGKGSIRAVFFGENAEKIIDMNTEKAKELYKKDKKEFFSKIELGKEYHFSGRVQINKFTNSPELVIINIKNVSPQKEIERLIK